MIKVYKIKIGEKVYEVEVEAVTEKEGKIVEQEKKEIKQETETPKPASGENAGNTGNIGDIIVKSPMQGLIISVDVAVGQTVKAGENLVVLEAMKMENPIVAPKNAVVRSIEVAKGDTVDTGTVLVTLS